MKTPVLVLFVLIAAALAAAPPGVVEIVYSKSGLDRHYTNIFKKAESTFGHQDLGTHGDIYGWWVFGTGMTIKDTYLDNYKLGEITKINYADSTYDFEHSEISGTFRYTWSYRWALVPFSHSAECTFYVGPHHISQKFVQDGENFVIQRDVTYTSGEPEINCEEGDAQQDSHWGFEWMKQVRAEYEKELGQNLKAVISNWLNTVDVLIPNVSSAVLDDMTYTLKPHLKLAQPDSDANLMIGYNFDISLNKAKRSPEAHEEMDKFDFSNDVSTFYFEEYFQSMVELDKEAVDFWLAVTSKNLPSGLTFGMKAKDFLYIIDGIQKYDPNTAMEVDCQYGDGNATISINNNVRFSLPILCTLKAANDKILTSHFEFVITGSPVISSQGAISLGDVAYQVLNFSASSTYGGKILTDYLVRRIESYANAANLVGGMEYFDQRFAGMTNLSVYAGKQYLRVSGNLPE